MIKELLAEKGQLSAMRFCMIITTLSAIGMGFYGLSKPQPDYSGITLLVSTMLAVAHGSKVLQKRVEVDGAKADSEISNKDV